MKHFLILLTLTFFFSGLKAATPLTVDGLTYYMPLNYNHSKYRQDSFTIGNYAYVGIGLKHSVEAEIDYSKLRYQFGNRKDEFDQWDFSFIYNYYTANSWKYIAGLHYIKIDDPRSDNSVTFFGGFSRYAPYQWNMQVQAYFSAYPNYRPRLAAYQVTPQIGFHIGNRIRSSLYFAARFYYIHLSEALSFGKQDFFSLESELIYTINRLDIIINGWAGEQAFSVNNSGLLVSNIEELYKGGYGGALVMRLTRNFRLKGGAQAEVFRDLFFPGLPVENNEATAIKYLLAIGWNFK
ncbi:MAG: hypothetical protein WAN36_15790 [Calditrichia bacterium]